MKYHLVWFIILVGLMGCKPQSEKPDVLVFSHAGMSLHQERTIYPANSFESIRYAIETLGVEGVEIDVQMTKDSVLVLFHDAFISESPGFKNCIASYQWEALKGLKLDNSNYGITTLKHALDYIVGQGRMAFLDFKTYDYCQQKTQSFEVLSQALDSIMSSYSDSESALVIGGSLSLDLLNTLTLKNKCFESNYVEFAIEQADSFDYNYILFNHELINDSTWGLLCQTSANWGIFGGKSNREIRDIISYNPNFVISDNISFAQKITE